MVKAIDIQESKDNYTIIRISAIFNPKALSVSDDLLQMLVSTFDDVTFHTDTKLVSIIQSTKNYDCLSNKDKVKIILDDFRKLLPFGSVTIIERRLPIKSVKYELTEKNNGKT